MDKPAFHLSDKYTLSEGKIYLTGIQALARLTLLQHHRDQEVGLNTGGFISGYRGSPLGGLDKTLWSINDLLAKHNIIFQAGINEDLAATSIWGSQQLNLYPNANFDGVFGLWYGKGPGVDRSGDVFKHANAAGTSKHGGVLLCMGDDHMAKSSSLPHQSEYALVDAGIPVLNPASIQEILDFGLLGWAMSRYSGCWVGLKTISETMDSSASVSADRHRVQIIQPHDFEFPEEGVHIRIPDTALEQEARLHEHKLYAAIAFARANSLNRILINPPQPRLGIITTGKSYLDVRQALSDLGIESKLAREMGIRLYKIGMPWPLDKQGVRDFADGLEEILVVEEKRGLIENQLKEQLFNWSSDKRPRVVGKFDEHHNWLLPSRAELTPARVARVIAQRIGRFVTSETIRSRLEFLEQKEKSLQTGALSLIRQPYFCSGCPHNTSTRVPDGSRANAGIGCHYMALWMDRETHTFTQMGGEGTPWIGQAPFCRTEHIFVNLGDGTYFHSGSLAIRAAIAADVNVTFKLLYNNAVAMTGGQSLDGDLDVPKLTRQLDAEGVKRIVIISDQPALYVDNNDLAMGVETYPRTDFERIQQSLRKQKGVSVLIYDQMCATEKRRQIKRGKLPGTKTFAYINTEVCEDCGDCSRQSNCLAVVPVKTLLGPKRQIDQAACNHDFSCLDGFCPSFVSIEGRRKSGQAHTLIAETADLKTPTLKDLKTPYAILIAGVGGTGIVTIGAILGVAAHIEGKGINVLDMTGLAQKFGAVSSHIQIADHADLIHATRIAAGHADLLLGCDAVTACGQDALSKLDRAHSHAIINDYPAVTADYINHPDRPFPSDEIQTLLADSVALDRLHFLDAKSLAEKACGNPIASNMLMIGYAWQLGFIPLSRPAIEQAISINGISVKMNLQAFNWGRRFAVHRHQVAKQLAIEEPPTPNLEAIISQNRHLLEQYQDKSLSDRYLSRVTRIHEIEKSMCGSSKLTRIIAQQYYRLLAIKDEYEVARLLTSESFKLELNAHFEPGYQIRYLLAPPLFSRSSNNSNKPRKISYGSWLRPVLKFLARISVIRNSWLDPFRYTTERRSDITLLARYENLMDQIELSIKPSNHNEVINLAQAPKRIKGFGDQRCLQAQLVIDSWKDTAVSKDA